MNKPDGQAYAIIGGVALTQLFFGLTLAIFPGWPKVGEWLNSEKAANWAQAVIAGVAILAGAAVIAWQVKRQAAIEAEREREEQVRKLQAINHGIFMLRIQLVMLRSVVHRGASHRKAMPQVMRTLQRLEQIPVLEIPTVGASQAVFSCISAMAQLTLSMEEIGPLLQDSLLSHFRFEQTNIALGFVVNSEADVLGELAALGSSGLGKYFDFEGTRYINGTAPD